MRTNNPKEIGVGIGIRTDSAQILAESEIKKMRFPKVIKLRRFEATIYGKGKKYPYYRVAFYAAGKRHLRNFRTYGEAKAEADRKVHELANGSQAAALSAQQSRDALVALEQPRATGWQEADWAKAGGGGEPWPDWGLGD